MINTLDLGDPITMDPTRFKEALPEFIPVSMMISQEPATGGSQLVPRYQQVAGMTITKPVDAIFESFSVPVGIYEPGMLPEDGICVRIPAGDPQIGNQFDLQLTLPVTVLADQEAAPNAYEDALDRKGESV